MSSTITITLSASAAAVDHKKEATLSEKVRDAVRALLKKIRISPLFSADEKKEMGAWEIVFCNQYLKGSTPHTDAEDAIAFFIGEYIHSSPEVRSAFEKESLQIRRMINPRANQALEVHAFERGMKEQDELCDYNVEEAVHAIVQKKLEALYITANSVNSGLQHSAAKIQNQQVNLMHQISAKTAEVQKVVEANAAKLQTAAQQTQALAAAAAAMK